MGPELDGAAVVSVEVSGEDARRPRAGEKRVYEDTGFGAEVLKVPIRGANASSQASGRQVVEQSAETDWVGGTQSVE